MTDPVQALDDNVLDIAEKWRGEGRDVALATVVQTWGSAPRGVGSHLAIDSDGSFVGSVSGGCVEGAVVTEAIDVIDSGPAVAGAQPGQSFEAEGSAGATYEKRVRGVGIGLTITLAIMDAHRGRIEVLSDDEDSSVFRVILPLA